MTKEDIIKYARETIGTPIIPQGRLCGIGLDCIGLIKYIADKGGYALPDYNHYSCRDSLMLSTLMDKHFKKTCHLSIANIISFQLYSTCHLGIYAGDTMIHSGKSVIAEVNFDTPWMSKVDAMYNWRGV